MRTARDAALALLARREHSRRELEAKLSRRFDPPAIAEALDQLISRGLLSDRRFAEVYVRTAGKKFGAQKLRRALSERGVSEQDAEAAMQGIAEGEAARAVAVLAAKYGDSELKGEKPRARAWRFLAGRGFSQDAAMEALDLHNRRAARNADPDPDQ